MADEERPLLARSQVSRPPSGGLPLFFATFCIVDLFGVFPIVALPRAIVNCGWIGIPLAFAVFSVQVYTAVLLGRCWIIAEHLEADIINKSRYPYAAVAELSFGSKVSKCVSVLLDVTVFGAGVPNLLVASQNLQLVGLKTSAWEFNFSYCYWLVILGVCLCPIMWLGSPKDMKWLTALSVIIVLTVAALTWSCMAFDDTIAIPAPLPAPSWETVGIAYGILAFQMLSNILVPILSASLDDLDLDDFPLESPADDEEHIGEVIVQDSNDVTAAQRESEVYKTVEAAMRKPGLRPQLGQVLPIIRAMTPPQRLALAALITSGRKDSLGAILPEKGRQSTAAQLLLPISWDIANMIRSATITQPEAEPLKRHIQPPRRIHVAHPTGHNRRNAVVSTEFQPPPPPPALKKRWPPSTMPSRERFPVTPAREQQHSSTKHTVPPQVTREHSTRPTVPPQRPTREHGKQEDPTGTCKLVGTNLCLEVEDYPDDAILASIRRSQGSLDSMLLDSAQRREFKDVRSDRRQDEVNNIVDETVDTASLCPSAVQLVRPKRARTTNGEWKYVVNVGEYTQTLRLDLCMRPHETCRLVSDKVTSRCEQVYNYHRLLTWDQSRGLHMDIFKVPTCCSCHITGMNPLLHGHHIRDQFPAGANKNPFIERPGPGAGLHDLDYHYREGPRPHSEDYASEDYDILRPPPPMPPARIDHSPPPPRVEQVGPVHPNLLHQRPDHQERATQKPQQGPRRPSPDLLKPRGPPIPLTEHAPHHPPQGGRRTRNNTAADMRLPEASHEAPQRRPPLLVINSDAIRSSSTPPPPHSTVGPKDGNHKRINYNYHPIIDFFQQQEPAPELQERSGEDWKPIDVRPDPV